MQSKNEFRYQKSALVKLCVLSQFTVYKRCARYLVSKLAPLLSNCVCLLIEALKFHYDKQCSVIIDKQASNSTRRYAAAAAIARHSYRYVCYCSLSMFCLTLRTYGNLSLLTLAAGQISQYTWL